MGGVNTQHCHNIIGVQYESMFVASLLGIRTSVAFTTTVHLIVKLSATLTLLASTSSYTHLIQNGGGGMAIYGSFTILNIIVVVVWVLYD